ncbi:MAG: enoyl-CoA hydratase/isomerase family protein [Hyphomicrobiaceae bacterium]
MTFPSAHDSDLIARRDGRAGRITLNRPQALNALTYNQILTIEKTLDTWANDGNIKLVLLDGAGDRAFCAGGDILAMYENRGDGGEFASQFWRDEYRLNAKISRYCKPIVSVMDGIVMGGGIGLGAHASHRIVTEYSSLAMPETGIGLVPDVGGTWLLANAPGRLGEFLGLLGERMAAADAIYAGFADTFVRRTDLKPLVSALTDSEGEALSVTLAHYASAPPAATLAPRQKDIDTFCSKPTLEEILGDLQTSSEEWAQSGAQTASTRSPLSMKLTLAAIRAARRLGALEDALNLEFRLTTRLFMHGEFIEGIRALLVDRDKTPRWQPPHMHDISKDMVTSFLAPLTSQPELDLTASDLR